MNSMNFDHNQAPNSARHVSQAVSNRQPENDTQNAKLESSKVQSASISEVSINPSDVLCGRGKVSFNHVGNRRFRDVISASVAQYNEAESRLEKAKIVNRIVEEIRGSGGRFLRQDEKAGTWHALNHAQCREKVGHAVRDATSSIEARKKRKLQQEATRKNVVGAIRTNPSHVISTTLEISGLPLTNASTSMKDADDRMFIRYQKSQTFSSLDPEDTARLVAFGGILPGPSEIFGGFQEQQLKQGIDQTLPETIKTTMLTQGASSYNTGPRKKTPKELEDDEDRFLAYIDEVLGPAPTPM